MNSRALNIQQSESLFERAQQLMPGGVNSPVRAFRAVGGTPLYFSKAKGSTLIDADGNEFIDYVASWGAIIHGHADPDVHEAILSAAENGTSYGAPHAGEIRLTEEILARVPALDWVRLVNSGTEATLSAIRLVRAATGRNKLVKFAGNYHGAVDSLLVKAGSGVATLGLPDSAGVPKEITADTLSATYNDLESVAAIMDIHGNEVAAILVEPVAGNMGLVPPSASFLAGLRRLCDHSGALLVMDEVMSGFRVARGGAAERFGVRPDVYCFGKVIGGGLPVGAYGGRAELKSLVAPLGPMYQAGTLSGNPLATAAGFAALSKLTPDAYERLESLGKRLETGLSQALTVPAQVQRVGSMISIFFTDFPVTNFEEAGNTDKDFFGRVFHKLLAAGIYLPPSALESWFFTTSHTEDQIDFTVESISQAVKDCQ